MTTPILVIDLEATCDEGDCLQASDMEIIEIGAVWATAEGIVLDEFQALVHPVVRPQLTLFCRQLTRIEQADVDSAEPFPVIAARLSSFAQRHHAPGATWGSWGQYDAKQLVRDCERHGIKHPLAAFQHVNLKRRFAKTRRIKEVGMARALQMVGLPLDGTHHRGLDDARNIAKLLPFAAIGEQQRVSPDSPGSAAPCGQRADWSAAAAPAGGSPPTRVARPRRR